jgi:hypothetical protein
MRNTEDSGMLGVTGFGIFFTPVFYVVVRWLTERSVKTTSPKARSHKDADESVASLVVNAVGTAPNPST